MNNEYRIIIIIRWIHSVEEISNSESTKELEEVNALRQKYGWEEVGVGHELVQKKKKARKIMEDMQESQLVNSRKEGDEKSGKKGAKTAKDKADKKPASSSSDNATKSDKRSGGDKEDKAKRAKTLFFFML